jgi:hypothetical protein
LNSARWTTASAAFAKNACVDARVGARPDRAEHSPMHVQTAALDPAQDCCDDADFDVVRMSANAQH